MPFLLKSASNGGATVSSSSPTIPTISTTTTSSDASGLSPGTTEKRFDLETGLPLLLSPAPHSKSDGGAPYKNGMLANENPIPVSPLNLKVEDGRDGIRHGGYTPNGWSSGRGSAMGEWWVDYLFIDPQIIKSQYSSLPHSPTDDATAPLVTKDPHSPYKPAGSNLPAAIPPLSLHKQSGEYEDYDGTDPSAPETFRQLLSRHTQNLIHFFVEDWFISAMLGAITAVLSISVDVSYEYLNEYRAHLFDQARAYDRFLGFVTWTGYLVAGVTAAALVCRYVAVQAIGSGIPEVKVSG
jgi:hypothetical protein